MMLKHLFWFNFKYILSIKFIEMIVIELNKEMCYNFTIHIQYNALDSRDYI